MFGQVAVENRQVRLSDEDGNGCVAGSSILVVGQEGNLVPIVRVKRSLFNMELSFVGVDIELEQHVLIVYAQSPGVDVLALPGQVISFYCLVLRRDVVVSDSRCEVESQVGGEVHVALEDTYVK